MRESLGRVPLGPLGIRERAQQDFYKMLQMGKAPSPISAPMPRTGGGDTGKGLRDLMGGFVALKKGLSDRDKAAAMQNIAKVYANQDGSLEEQMGMEPWPGPDPAGAVTAALENPLTAGLAPGYADQAAAMQAAQAKTDTATAKREKLGTLYRQFTVASNNADVPGMQEVQDALFGMGDGGGGERVQARIDQVRTENDQVEMLGTLYEVGSPEWERGRRIVGTPQWDGFYKNATKTPTPQTLTTAMKNALAIGLEPGTPEYEAYIRNPGGSKGAGKGAGKRGWYWDLVQKRNVFLTPDQYDPEIHRPERKLDTVHAKWRSEFKPLLAAILENDRKFAAVKVGYKARTGTGDIAMINAVQKTIDDGVVREGDVHLQRTAASARDKMTVWYENYVSGDLMSDTMRNRLWDIAQGLYTEIGNTFLSGLGQQMTLLDANGLDVNKLVPKAYQTRAEEALAQAQGADAFPIAQNANDVARLSATGQPFRVWNDGVLVTYRGTGQSEPY